MNIRILLLATLPVAPLTSGLGAPPLLVFAVGLLAIGVTAEWIRAATEQLALHLGPAIGGLLTISLGSLAEFILALFVLAEGQIAVVHAQITGSIMATSLLGLGIAVVVGGATRPRQTFRRERAGLLSSLLVLVVIALLLPAVFDYTDRAVLGAADVTKSDESLSLVVAIVLLVLYVGNLIFTLITHRDVFASGEETAETATWSVMACLATLGLATVAAAGEAELVSGSLTEASGALGLSTLFLGVVVLALVGTMSDLFAAIFFARKDQMDLVMSICIGSAIQVGLVIAPLLVVVSWLMSLWGDATRMTLVFTNPLDLFAIAGTALVVRTIASDGETTWFEGMLLIGVYVVLAAAYLFA